MSELLKINVNDHTEKKGNLTYLSWAWAWAEVLKIDPAARWTAHEWDGLPCMYLKNGSAMVKVSVEIKGDIKTCVLPIMNHRNQAVVDPDSFQVNTAIMRCLAKAIAMHGLGLYIYSGEDLPQGDPGDPKVIDKIKALPDVTSLNRFYKELSVDDRARYMGHFATRKKELSGGDNGPAVA